MMNTIILQVMNLFKSYVFWSAFSAWFISQLAKSIIAFLNTPGEKKAKVFFEKFGSTGGIPSSHSAVVSALSLAIGFSEGFDSNSFIIAFFLASIVIRDAIGVRLSNGVQAKTLNSLGTQVAEKMDIPFSPVREVNGHTKQEVFVGIVIGLITTCICVHIF
ncbi:MAG: divergent PAP2 family protein [Treponemataceae bacterium]